MTRRIRETIPDLPDDFGKGPQPDVEGMFDVLGLRTKLAAAERTNKALVEALQGFMSAIEAGVLVRDTSRDHETGWAVHQLPLILLLKQAEAALRLAEETK